MVLNSSTPMCSAYTAVPERVTTPTRRGVAATRDGQQITSLAPDPARGINQNEKNKVSSTLLSLRLDAQPTVTY